MTPKKVTSIFAEVDGNFLFFYRIMWKGLGEPEKEQQPYLMMALTAIPLTFD